MNSLITENIKSLQLPSRFETKLIADINYLLSYTIADLESIILFGSCARGKPRLTSDIDLLIITTNPLSRAIRGEISSDLEEPLDAIKTDVVFYTNEQYVHSSRIFTHQVKNEGISLYNTRA